MTFQNLLADIIVILVGPDTDCVVVAAGEQFVGLLEEPVYEFYVLGMALQD